MTGTAPISPYRQDSFKALFGKRIRRHLGLSQRPTGTLNTETTFKEGMPALLMWVES